VVQRPYWFLNVGPVGLVREDQLQPLLVAAVVCVWTAWASVVQRDFCGGVGECFVLFRGTADVADAGETSGETESGVGRGGLGRGCSLFPEVGFFFAPSGLF